MRISIICFIWIGAFTTAVSAVPRYGQEVEIDGTVLTAAAGGRDCDPDYYYDDTTIPAWAYSIPDPWGFQADFYNTRYTVPTDAPPYPVKAVSILMYGPYMTGQPDMRIYIWDDDGTGNPGAKRDSVDIPYDSLLAADYGWVTVSFDGATSYQPDEDFHVGWTIVGGVGDTLYCVGDNGTGDHIDENRSIMYWGITGEWVTFNEVLSGESELFIQAYRCDPFHQPTTLNVPGEYATIQAAIDAAEHDDTILVADGVYTGEGNRDLELPGLDLIVKSVNGPATTVIDCQGDSTDQHRAFRIDASSMSVVIDGFTIRNGWDDYGGGIRIDNGWVTIRNCILEDNTSEYYGGAIALDGDVLQMRDCTFENNRSKEHSGAVSSAGDLSISNCTFLRNQAEYHSACIWNYGRSPQIDSCLFVDNSSSWGGVLVLESCTGEVTRCTFYDNGTNTIAVHSATPHFSHCLIAFGTGLGMPVGGPGSSPELECCNIYGNDGGDWVGDIADQLGQDGNISLNPHFCDTAAGDLHVDSLSPCVPSSVHNACGELIGLYGPACRVCTDSDADSVCDDGDNCPEITNPDQADSDQDGTGDLCDPCPDDPEDDIDGDSLCADVDNCPHDYNPDQADQDTDGVGDICDNCLTVANPEQGDFDQDDIGDSCDTCTDLDGDGFGDPGFPANTCPDDNCSGIPNPDQTDIDNDGIGDVCDGCIDMDADGYGDPGYPNPFCDEDNCPDIYNPDQSDVDADGVGDSCDICPEAYDPGQEDTDGDGFGDACDNCPDLYNSSQNDLDEDGIGDVCDICPLDPDNDIDGDSICGDVDNCPSDYNPDQEDTDQDGIGDSCCCVGIRGNVDNDPADAVNIVDLTTLVEYLFGGGTAPACPDEANVDGDPGGAINIVDLTYLVGYLFGGGDEPGPCP